MMPPTTIAIKMLRCGFCTSPPKSRICRRPEYAKTMPPLARAPSTAPPPSGAKPPPMVKFAEENVENISTAVRVGMMSFQIVTYLFDSLSSFAPIELSRKNTKSRTKPTSVPVHERTVVPSTTLRNPSCSQWPPT
jgi:hypothetical protein